MIREDVHEIVEFLNTILKIDEEFMWELFNTRIKVNDELLNHPTVQCTSSGTIRYEGEQPTKAAVMGSQRSGILGLLNGYFGTYEYGSREGWGAISMVMSVEEGNSRIEKFVVEDNLKEDK